MIAGGDLNPLVTVRATRAIREMGLWYSGSPSPARDPRIEASNAYLLPPPAAAAAATLSSPSSSPGSKVPISISFTGRMIQRFPHEFRALGLVAP